MSSLHHATLVIAHLIEHGESLCVAESITAGGLGHAITSAPGASEVFRGGVIAYSNEVKENFLNVPPSLIAEYGVVSEEVAVAMAAGAREKFDTTWAISTTGVAGPGSHEGVAEGTVWIAIVGPTHHTLHLQLDSGREAIRTGAISSAIGSFSRILSARN
jgi:nicotinamide-nucleotide amidase